MPGTSTSSYFGAYTAFHSPSLPFCLKTLLLTSVATAGHAVLRNGFSEKNVLDNAVKGALITHLNEMSVSDYSALVFSESGDTKGQKEDEVSNSFVQRHLLQVPLPTTLEHQSIVVANPIPDQFIQIGREYTYSLSRVFSGDYFQIQASALPDGLKLAYKTLGSYRTNTSTAFGIALSNTTAFLANWDAGLLILNVDNPSDPQLLATYLAGSGFALGVAVSSNILFLANGEAGLHILGISNTWQLKIKANPSWENAGNYPLVLKATDKIGGFTSIPFTLRVEGAPQVNNPVQWQYAEVERHFFFNIPVDTFVDPNSDPLVLSLSQINRTKLPNWLIFNRISEVLSGTPDPQDKGTHLLRLTAQDSRGGIVYTDFNLTVVDPPKTIPGQPFSLIQNRRFNYALPLGPIFDADVQPFSYTIIFPDQDQTESYWLDHTISNATLILSGIPNITGKFTLLLSAKTMFGYQASTPFILSITPSFPPQLRQSISSQTADVGVKFDFVLPSGTFEDNSGDTLHYKATLMGGGSLPEWLTFSEKNGGSWHFTGTPDGWDTDFFSSRTMILQVTAYDSGNSSATTLFNLAVTGTSTLRLIITVAAPILSILGLFKKRATFLNRLCYNRYQKSSHTLEAGQGFSIKLSTPRDSVGSIEVKKRHIPSKGCSRFVDCQRFFKPPINYLQLPFDSLPEGNLPKWMEYKETKNTLRGVLPTDINRELVVRVKNQSGVVQEQFALKIEGAVLDQNNDETPVLPRSKQGQRNQRRIEKSDVELDNAETGMGYSRLQG